MDSFVRYGDLVYILGKPDQITNPDLDISGVISATGFINDEVYLEICNFNIFENNNCENNNNTIK